MPGINFIYAHLNRVIREQDANRVNRYHVLSQAVQAAAHTNPAVAAKGERIIQRYERKLAEHRDYVRVHGEDPPEIAAWTRDA